ncbi:glycoside hydrolase family 128 protein, partial [Aplosporella prunicola CBS 121167]
TPSSSAAAVTSAPASSVVSSSAVASATSTPSSSSGSAKRGLVYNTFSLISEFSASVSIGWMYNWAQTPGGTIPSTLEYVPQLWGLRTAYDTPDWKSNAEEQISLGSTHLMGYNEPDVEDGAGGSFLSATEAAEGWMTYMQPFAGKAKLVSPGVCNGEGVRPATGRNQGLDWLEDFVSACSSCTIDKINVHWYASYTGMGSDMETVVSYFKEYMEKAYKKFNKPLWVTEFELQGLDGVEGADEIEAKFIKEIDTYVASTAWIERYSYFKTETIVTKTALKTAYIS